MLACSCIADKIKLAGWISVSYNWSFLKQPTGLHGATPKDLLLNEVRSVMRSDDLRYGTVSCKNC